ncbi:MAG: nitrous oxide reductase family maturation protein NosD [candidate division Zixibacteria bacterium]|nr:nitrous oxide reductase family maturation protein NosD [candidate division Zixibacteria bacterium]
MKFIIVAILIATFSPAFCRIHTIKSADDFKDKLLDSSGYDTLYLDKGIYQGQFTVSAPVVIIGDSSTILDGNTIGDVVTIVADSVSLKGITVQNSGTRLLKDHAGIKIAGDYVEISNCTIRDNLHGIYIKAGNNIRIQDNNIIGRFDIQEADRGNGIHLWNTADNLVENNNISYARDGIYFSFANNTSIKNNHIHHLRYGLHYMYSDSNSFEDNLFEYNIAGSALMFSESIVFQRNVFAHCRGFRAYGLLLQSVDNCYAADNLILNNTKAVFFSNSSYNRFENNDIIQNDLAVQINVSCEGNTLVSNNFISNLAEVMMDATVVSSTKWSEKNIGNFWTAYSGYDLDNNQVGDTPYQLQSVFEFIEIDNPAIRFYLYSPASQLLAAAEKRLPILRKKTIEDPNPLFRPNKNSNIPHDNIMDFERDISWSHLIFWVMVLILPVSLGWVALK